MHLLVAGLCSCLLCVLPGFIKKAIKYYADQFGSDDEAAVRAPPKRDEAAERADKADLPEKAMLCAFGKVTKAYEQVTIEKMMEDEGLSKLYPPESWPETNAVRDLATEIRAARKGK